MVLFPRIILPKLEAELTKKEVTVITGMRQVGKTTLLTYLFEKVRSKNKVLLDLENPLYRKIFEEENFDNIWGNLAGFGVQKNKPAFIFLDEIQNLPLISKVVKYFYDHWRTKFIVTGSSSFYLKNLFPESLSGRKVIYELFPLTFAEFLVFKGFPKPAKATFAQKAALKNEVRYHQLSKLYQEYMEYGGFPAVVLVPDVERKKQILENVFTSYFEIDVKSLADFREISKLRDLILLLIPRIGSKLDITRISSELGVARETVYSYLNFLESTYFISLVPRFTRSIDRQAAGAKKVYLCDGGLANVIGRVAEGSLFEQSVFQNLRPRHEIRYYDRGGGREIDFVVDSKIALEVKTAGTKRDLQSLKQQCKSVHLTEYYVVTLRHANLERTILGSDV